MYSLISISKLPVNLNLLQEQRRLTSFAYSSERVNINWWDPCGFGLTKTVDKNSPVSWQIGTITPFSSSLLISVSINPVSTFENLLDASFVVGCYS